MINNKLFSTGVQDAFRWLIDLGYKFKQTDQNIYFERVNENETFAIGFSWAEYNEIMVNGFAVYKGFNLLEKAIAEVIHQPFNYSIVHRWQGGIPEGFEEAKDQKRFPNAFFVANTAQITDFSLLVKSFFENEAKTFLNKFSDLNSVIKEMDSLPSDKKTSLIFNANNSALLRIMAIKYFTDPAEGEKFYSETVKELDPLKNQRVFNEILQNIHKLKTKLESILI